MNKIEHPDLSQLAIDHFDAVCTKVKYPHKEKLPDEILQFRKDSIAGKLFYKKRDITLLPEVRELFEYLYNNLWGIITGDVKSLLKTIQDVNNHLQQFGINMDSAVSGQNGAASISDTIYECFNYDGYSVSDKPYDVLKKLNIDVCPYCNRQYISTYLDPDGKTRPTLDHFYSKKQYPYLSNSFFNLIPSCYSCNSSFKGKIEFTFKTHIHPFTECFDGIVKFSINFKKGENTADYIAQFYHNNDTLDIGFEYLVPPNSKKYQKAFRNIKTFHLKNIYNRFHKDMVVELLQKQAIYNTSGYAKSLATTFPKLFNSENDILKMILGNYIQNGQLNNRPLSRLVRDISEEIGLTDEILADLNQHIT